MADIEMGYWKIRGLGAPVRMLLEYAQAKYKERQYETGDDWFGGRKPELLKMNPLANLPYVVDGDRCVCQSNAVLMYLGEKFGLDGTDKALKVRTQELLAEIFDVRNGMIDLVYPGAGVCRNQQEFESKAKATLADPPFAKFESCLKFYGGEWFVLADGPGVADFPIWEMLDQFRMLAEKLGQPPVLDKFPLCKAFYERFRALPTLQAYFVSPAYKLDVNNKYANVYFLETPLYLQAEVVPVMVV
eukprot:CAMPEP_0171139406 /NCGR_PEP_ID=MMETSP0766_2-20121228/136832_1 /TAXON_ID=439317 /ORGANISM="Gambierdiscus australes, Strain CAWD 149" /LENGTH=244 /DNA_ID=CAMNT_0011603069 /DNA_START=27 /DNA_END=759 /DNA_ORIENTATION=-